MRLSLNHDLGDLVAGTGTGTYADRLSGDDEVHTRIDD